METILPFSKMPRILHARLGAVLRYGHAGRRSAIPLLAKSHDGRPVKIEGNPQHPDSNGGTDQFAQASILNLLRSDRATRLAKNGSGVSRESALDFLDVLSKQTQANGGEGLAILMEQSSSVSRARLQKILSESCPKPAGLPTSRLISIFIA